MSLTPSFASVATNFVRLQSATNYGYYAFEEVAHIFYCLLQKTKGCGTLPLVEQWEKYMTPHPSRFSAIVEELFLLESRVLIALEKVKSYCLKSEFRRDCQKNP